MIILRMIKSKTMRTRINEKKYRNNQLFLVYLMINIVIEMRMRMVMIPQILNMILVLQRRELINEVK